MKQVSIYDPASSVGWLLAIVFAVATALPVIAVAFILAFSMNSIGTFYGKMQAIQHWVNIVVAVLFIIIGIYLTLSTIL